MTERIGDTLFLKFVRFALALADKHRRRGISNPVILEGKQEKKGLLIK